MTDYLITMDTGEQFLAHHGVKGMKWGKWNSETAEKYQGGDGKRKGMSDSTKQKLKTAGKVAAVVGGTALAAYGIKKGADKLASNPELMDAFTERLTKRNQKGNKARSDWATMQRLQQDKKNLETLKYNRRGVTPKQRVAINNLKEDYRTLNRDNKQSIEKFVDIGLERSKKKYSKSGQAYANATAAANRLEKAVMKKASNTTTVSEALKGGAVGALAGGAYLTAKQLNKSKKASKPVLKEHQEAREKFKNKNKLNR